MSAGNTQRDKNVRETIDRIRTLKRKQGVNSEALESIKAVLLDWAAQTELFPASEFYPEKDAHGMYPIYRLSEDEDHRFAMYMSTSIGAKDVPPHDHTTWAVIVGVQGTEENRFYERIDDGSVPGKGQLKQVGGEMVRPGDCRRHSDQFVELHLYHCPQRLVRQRSIEGAD